MTRRVLLLCLAPALFAQSDSLRVASPNGQIEFRLFISEPTDRGAALPRLAYQVWFHGKPLVETSYLGMDILNQQPLLGEKIGLIGSKAGTVTGGNSLVGEYLQNGSLGRRVNIEVRAYDDGVAFRYVIPKSVPLDEILIGDETTEFQFAPDAVAQGTKVSEIKPELRIPLPFVVEQPGVGWVAITETPASNYSKMNLRRWEGTVMISALVPHSEVPPLAVEGKTPLTTPWRVLLIGTAPPPLDSDLLHRLNP
jgi:alpha-glucosidase